MTHPEFHVRGEFFVCVQGMFLNQEVQVFYEP
jgi:hypothetical protein